MASLYDFSYSGSKTDRLNWPLLLLIFLLPLQNIYLGKIPSLGAGLNILNIIMLIAYISAVMRSETRFGNSMNRYILYMIAGYVFSFFVANSFMGWDERSLFMLKDIFFAYLFFFVTYKSIAGVRMLKAVFWSTVLPLPYMFKVFYTNLSWMGFSSYRDKLRFNNGTFMDLGSNEIAAFYASYTFVLLSFIQIETDWKRKCFLLLCVGFNIYSLIYSFSRGAYLASLVGLAVYCWFAKRIKTMLVALIIATLLVVAGVDIFPRAVSERFDSVFVEDAKRDESAQSRIVLWDLAMDNIRKHPVFGIGFNNFHKMNEYGKDTHNYYVKMLTEGGSVGLIIFLSFMIAAYCRGLKLYRNSDDMHTKRFAAGFLACMAAIIVGNLFGDRFTHYPLISYFFVYLAIVVKLLEYRKEMM